LHSLTPPESAHGIAMTIIELFRTAGNRLTSIAFLARVSRVGDFFHPIRNRKALW
jgi:hypothetical protein